ncbi:MAG: arsenate reductase ArsC [Dehalococcoidia bacterium]
MPQTDREGHSSGSGKPRIVFLCVHNAGRSQMAAAWARRLGGERVEVLSGGSNPASDVNPTVIRAMAEAGIDISRRLPSPWTEEMVRSADVVITMGCGDSCPVFPGVTYRDWPVRDPHGKGIESVRRIRDDLESRVRALIAELTESPV